MAERSPNIITSLSHNPLIAGLVALMFVTIVGFGANSYYVILNIGWDEQRIDYANQIKVISQEISKNANAVATGTVEDLSALRGPMAEFEENFGYLMDGNLALNLPPSPDEVVNGPLGDVRSFWGAIEQSAMQIEANFGAYGELRKISSDLDITSSVIQQEYGRIVAALLRDGSSPSQIVLVQKQPFLIEKMAHNVDRVLEIGSTKNLQENFTRARAEFRRVQDGLINGDRELLLTPVTQRSQVEALTKIDEQFRSIPNWSAIQRSADEVESLRQAVATIHVQSDQLSDAADALIIRYRELAAARPFSTTTGLVLGGVSFLLIMIIAGFLYREANTGLRETALRNEQNQTAILTLLDEIADLADGDLTVQATVTESFTGAIADSINFAIDQMRAVVSKINETSTHVSSAAQSTQKTAHELAESSQRQYDEISDVTGAVDAMAISIDRVSASAAESSAVAERSVEIANKGAEVVQNTIDGMEKIRGQIQETSKRIKRLGESSQEIGDIVSLINDIADQTNILSLNAAIQASMAGDAGRGFAVVADEVQRLAERSGAAAKQIDGLVKTIQSDTNEAVMSMEQTTAEVVQGTSLAADAGVALGEIENVSKSLAEIIENISDTARQQAASAGQISNTMKSIQEITSQTTDGTRSTANSVGQLAEMTNELRASVSGFKLPG